MISSTLNLLTLALVTISSCENSTDPLSFLTKFGYIDASIVSDLPADGSAAAPAPNIDISAAVRKFQNFVGLEETGELNDETIEWMQKPRCGVKDFSNNTENDSPLAQPFQVYSKWTSRNELSWRLNSYSTKLTRDQVISSVKKAFNYWSSVTNIFFFEKTSGEVDIPIDFVTYRHGDGDPFDGPGGTLAHAYYPEVGDIHIDDSETWTLDSEWGTNFLQTLTHEIGHSIGLKHSHIRGAVMFPFAGAYNRNFQLHQDDIDGARYLYGHRAPAPPTEYPPIPAFPCPDPGHNTRDRLGAELTEGVASWAACAALCRGRAGCRYWTWHHEDAGQFAFRCVTMEDVISRVPDQNAVSGTKKCVG